MFCEMFGLRFENRQLVLSSCQLFYSEWMRPWSMVSKRGCTCTRIIIADLNEMNNMLIMLSLECPVKSFLPSPESTLSSRRSPQVCLIPWHRIEAQMKLPNYALISSHPFKLHAVTSHNSLVFFLIYY